MERPYVMKNCVVELHLRTGEIFELKYYMDIKDKDRILGILKESHKGKLKTIKFREED